MNINKSCIIILCLIIGFFLFGCSGGGSSSNSPAQLDLTGSGQGQSVAFVDVDGDGIEDKLVGAPWASASSGRGVVLVYEGTGSGYSSDPVIVMSGDQNFGYSVANVGDVDGDHKDDFAVGAINGSGAGNTDPSISGTVVIYKGGSKREVIRHLAGEGPMDKFGFSLAAGDLNKDGFNDVIVGAPFNTNHPSLYQKGAVYVYFGPDFVKKVPIYASSTVSGLGWEVASGDINGDGVADLLISASGKLIGFYGSAEFAPSINLPDLSISCSAAGFAKAIEVIGDVDTDGKKDIAIGAPNATINQNRDTGTVYIVKGGAGRRDVDLNSVPADLIVRIDGNSLFDRFGSSIALAGDIDKDGIPDFAVGAPMADVNTNDLSGKVYLFKGKDIGPSANITGSTVFNGMTKNQAFGTALASNKKGQILIGGPRANANTGGVMTVDAATGNPVSGGSSGGNTGGGDSCH